MVSGTKDEAARFLLLLGRDFKGLLPVIFYHC